MALVRSVSNRYGCHDKDGYGGHHQDSAHGGHDVSCHSFFFVGIGDFISFNGKVFRVKKLIYDEETRKRMAEEKASSRFPVRQ